MCVCVNIYICTVNDLGGAFVFGDDFRGSEIQLLLLSFFADDIVLELQEKTPSATEKKIRERERERESN